MAINMCLAANGGTLADSAGELDRDNSFTTISKEFDFNPSGSGSWTASITFPSCSVSSVKYRFDWNGSSPDGSYAWTVYLYYGGTWNSVYSGSGSGIGSGDTGEATTTGTWNGVTGARYVMSCSGNSGVTRLRSYELQAWGNKPNGSQIINII